MDEMLSSPCGMTPLYHGGGKIEIPFQGEPYRRNPANTKMLRFRVLPSG